MAETIISQPTLFAILLGLVPSLIWLVFWLHLAKGQREPFGLLFICFIMGGVSVLVATFLQRGAKGFIDDANTRMIVWAGIEEILKFGVFYFIAYKSDYANDNALDPAIYLIAVALGFAALENIFYVLKPAQSFNVTASLLTGGLRFFGSTLLHTIASCFIGIFIALTPRQWRGIGILIGIAGAIFLHSTFNFFILKNDTASFLQIYGYLWVTAIISHVILEKLRRFPVGTPATI
jgi:RsiW-degrading membrane proteinase PrsW (M82 family)